MAVERQDQTMTITEFMEARIAEDEADARNAPKMSDVYDVNRLAFTDAMRQRVLAECAAKRAIMEAHPATIQLWWEEQCEIEVCETCQEDSYPDSWPCPTIQALAAVYASHPGYRQEWAP